MKEGSIIAMRCRHREILVRDLVLPPHIVQNANARFFGEIDSARYTAGEFIAEWLLRGDSSIARRGLILARV